MALSSTSTTTSEGKYHVFLSFRGQDTRVGFTSHLYTALNRANISTFIDTNLERGEEISPSLLRTIEDSKLSVIIFSGNYASSKWCLDELVKILECRKNGQTDVVPVFYQVDPSHVRNQTGIYGDAFARYEQLLKEKALEMDRVHNWRAALKEAADISGWDSRGMLSESKFVEEIVEDIFNKLYKMSASHPTSLVGIDARIKEIESLLRMESQEIRIVGIWGMGGIGKTTLDRAVFDRIWTKFEGFHFLENVRVKSEKHGVSVLPNKLFSKSLDRDHRLRLPLSSGNAFMKDVLSCKKVLIVLDDVPSLWHLQELLLGSYNSFGSGSKILVTGRDMSVLDETIVDATYKVRELNREEARKLFNLKAFQNYNPSIDDEGSDQLLEMMIDYAKGNPLAITVLGSSLVGKSKEKWDGALKELRKNSVPEIENVLRISYKALNTDQKRLFLDFAFFFRGWSQNRVREILDGVDHIINVLINKSLITVSENNLEMHDLLQEMAYRIVREESKNVGKRSRLCDPEDGTDEIGGISLDMSELSREMHLESDVFSGMDSLRILKFYGALKLRLPECGLQYLPDELRYLQWDCFPSKTLPQNFCAENLVVLRFRWSKIEKLWRGVQNIVNLRRMDFSFSRCLTKLPDLSKAINLGFINLSCCVSLIEVPSSIQYLNKLEYFNVLDCSNLRSLPRQIHSKLLTKLIITNCSAITACPEVTGDIEFLYLGGTTLKQLPQSICKLKILDVSGCSNITKFPEVPRDIKCLYLSGTDIEEVPSSIESITRLCVLEMNDCRQLYSLPSSICKLKSLIRLYLSRCPKLESFPEIFEPMESLKYLLLGETWIKDLPPSIKHLKSLHLLELQGTFIKELPELPPLLKNLKVHNCEYLETLPSSTRSYLEELNFANCFKLDHKALSADMYLKIQSREVGVVLLPGSEIPEWFCNQSMGGSITIRLPSKYHKIKGIVISLVFQLLVGSDDFFDKLMEGRNRGVLDFVCVAKSKIGEDDNVILKWFSYPTGFMFSKIHDDSDHMLLQHQRIRENEFCEFSGNEVTFEFYPTAPFYKKDKTKQSELEKHCKVKHCGVYFQFDESPPSIFDSD